MNNCRFADETYKNKGIAKTIENTLGRNVNVTKITIQSGSQWFYARYIILNIHRFWNIPRSGHICIDFQDSVWNGPLFSTDFQWDFSTDFIEEWKISANFHFAGYYFAQLILDQMFMINWLLYIFSELLL